MKLNALAGGNAQRVVAIQPGEFVENLPLMRRHDPAGNAPADHHDILFTRRALVAIILLVATVELQKLVVIPRELVGGGIRKRGRNSAGEERIGILDILVMR